MSLLLAPVQGVGLKIKRYRIFNHQIDLVNRIDNYYVNQIVINDSTVANTTANTYTQIKSYSISIPNNDFNRRVVNAVRVQIYGYVSAGTGYVEVLINGSAPTIIKSIVGLGNSNSFSNTSNALIFDAILSLSGISSPYTLSINAYNGTSGDNTYIADVYGFQGLAITSTSPQTIDQKEAIGEILDEIGVNYALYSGSRILIYANRYTTANATASVSDQWGGGTSFNIPAGNDSANVGNVYTPNTDYGVSSPNIPTGYNGSMQATASAYVGASGDILLIGYCYVWFQFRLIQFPNGPHYGLIETSYSIWQSGSLAVQDTNALCGYSSPTGCQTFVNTIFNVSNANTWTNNVAAANFGIDEKYELFVGSSYETIFINLFVVVLE